MTVQTIHKIVSLYGLPPSSAHQGRGWQYRGAVDLCNKVEVWWPKISPCNPSSGWRNIPNSNDDNVLVEIAERYVHNADVNTAHVHEILKRRQTRLVFGRFLKQQGYTYLGRFELDVVATQNRNECVWVLKSSPDSFDADKQWASRVDESDFR